MANPRDNFETENRMWGDRPITYASLYRILDPIYDTLERLMAEEKDLVTAQAEEATELATVTSDLATLSTDTTNAIAALQKKVESGGLVTAEELATAVANSQSVTKGLQTLDASVKSEDATVNPPAPAPTPAPEPTPAPTPTTEPTPAA